MQVRTSYTRLLVTDLKACFAFYRDIMEFKVIVDATHEGYAEFAAGEMKLAISQRQEMAEIIGSDRLPLHAECQDRVVLVFVYFLLHIIIIIIFYVDAVNLNK